MPNSNQDAIRADLEISKKICRLAYNALDDKQGMDIKVLDIHDISFWLIILSLRMVIIPITFRL